MREKYIQSITESIHRVKREIWCRLSQRPHLSITPSEWLILSILKEHEGIHTKDLSTKLGVTKSAISQLLKKLDTRGYIKRATNSTDHRCSLVYLTPTAKKFVSDLQEEMSGGLENIFTTLTNTELRSLATLHKKIADRTTHI